MIITLFLFIICVVAICKNASKSLSEKQKFTNILKFVTALFVVNGHLFVFGGGPHSWAQEMNIGPLCVSLFFFLSGYGLMCSYERKGAAYFKGFLSHRLGRVIFPLITAYIVTLPVYRIVVGEIDWHTVFSTFYWGGPFLRFSWYVTEIVLLYLFFYVIMRSSVSKQHKIYVLTFVILLMMGVLIATKQPIWYIESLPAFMIGFWFQRYEKKMYNEFLTGGSEKIGVVILLSLVLLITFHWHFVVEHVQMLSAFRYQYASYYIMNIVFVILIIIAMKGVETHITFPPALTNSYYEIYLMQSCVMLALRDVTRSFLVYWLGVMLLTVVLAVLMHKGNSLLMKSLKI